MYFIPVKSQYTSEMKDVLAKVKEAASHDSLQLFTLGNKAISLANKSNQKKAISNVYLFYGNYYYYTQNIDLAMYYMNKAISSAKEHKNKHIEYIANTRLIFLDGEVGLSSNTEEELLALLETVKKNKDSDEAYLELLNLIGVVKESKNKHQEALKLYLEGLIYAEAHSITYYPAAFLNNLGLLKLYTNQVEEALVDFKKAEKYAEKENDENLTSHIQLNICLILIQKNETKEAFKIFDKIISHARKNDHPRELSSAFINMATAFVNTNPNLALAYTDSAITALKNKSLITELTRAYLGKTETLIKLNKYNDAKITVQEARKLINNTKNLEDESTYYFLLYKIDNSEKNYKNALNNYLLHRKIKDSIEQKLNSKTIQGLQLKYNVQKKEIELEKEKSKSLLLEQKNQKEQFLKWLAIGIGFVVIIIVISTVSYFYSKKLQEKQTLFSQQLIENIEADRLRISMDLHDDIGQSLSIIKSKLSIGKNETEFKQLDVELARVIEQTREISKNLYPSYLEKIGLSRSIARLMESVQASTNIECSFDVTELVENLPISTKTHLYRIIQECTNNTIKHAKASALKVSITESSDGFTLVYRDNGVGITSKHKNGLGLLSIKERAKIINGSVNFEEKTNKSFKLTLRFTV